MIKRLISSVKRFIVAAVRLFANIPGAIKNAYSKSYYPERQSKSRLSKIKDNLLWDFRYHEVNSFYTLYGLDCCGSNPHLFIDNNSFMDSRNKANRLRQLNSQAVLLRDKFLFYKYMKSSDMPVPEVFAMLRGGVLYDTSMNRLDDDFLKAETDYFLKDIDGECASFVRHIHNYEEFCGLRDRLMKGSYIFQRTIYQHAGMNRINGKAINTIRIVTINRDGNPYVLSALLRVGTNRTGNVDNWAAGGLAIGINENGYLKQYGLFKPKFGQKTDVHPDTGVTLSEFQVPMYSQAVEAACNAHRLFYGVRAIGWDVAITENGPVFIEGNDNWEISLMQACDRPLKDEWIKACK